MVKVRTFLISLLFFTSSALILSDMLSAAFSTSGSNLYGRPYSARIACISVSFSPISPSTSVRCPEGFGSPRFQLSTTAATFIPERAVSSLRSPSTVSYTPLTANSFLPVGLRAPVFAVSGFTSMAMSYGMVLLCIITQACFPTVWSTPMKGLVDLSSIFLISPSRLWPLRASRVTATMTLSPFRALWVFAAFTKMSSS